MSKLAIEIPASVIETELNKEYPGFELHGLIFYELNPTTKVFRIDALLYDLTKTEYSRQEVTEDFPRSRFYRNAPGSTVINVEIDPETEEGQLELELSELEFWYNAVNYVTFLKEDLEKLLAAPKPEGLIFSGTSLNIGLGFNSYAVEDIIRPYPTLKAERFTDAQKYTPQEAMMVTWSFLQTAYGQPCPPYCPRS